jgi:hypothetical protein
VSRERGATTEGALNRNVLYYGQEEPLPEQTELRAGPLSLSTPDEAAASTSDRFAPE